MMSMQIAMQNIKRTYFLNANFQAVYVKIFMQYKM